MIAKLITCVFCNKDKNFGECLLTYRKSALFGAFAFSILVALAIIWYSDAIMQILCIKYDNQETVFRGLLYSLSPLPLFFLLWFFRHTDTQENLQQNTLFEAQRLIVEASDSKKALAIRKLRQLLDDVPKYEKQIYFALEAGLKKQQGWNKSIALDIHIFDLSNRNLQNTDLKYENLQGANLQGTNLQGADLEGADWRGVNLQGVNLHKANLTNTILVGANLTNTHLEKANLTNTHLRLADLRGADLRGATWQLYELSHVNDQDFLIEDYEFPMYNDATELFDPFAHYSCLNEDEREEMEEEVLEEYHFIHENAFTTEMKEARKKAHADIRFYLPLNEQPHLFTNYS